MKNLKLAGLLALAATAVMTSAPVMAEAVDVTDLVTDIGAQIAPIALVGGAVLLVVISIKAFKWIRASFS